MGMHQSVYKQGNFGHYFKMTRTEHALIKEVWLGIERNPQFHGNAFFTGFCELYPHYVKFYTLDPRLPLHFDARSNAKFTMIMEALGYLLLDFFNKPKQLDRLVGYIAMSHKDMRLEKQDMFNFGYCLLDYLAQTFPIQMTAPCQDAITKYLTSILDELTWKMETFRGYEKMHGMKPTQRLRVPFVWLTPCISNNVVFGQTMAYWRNRKREWDRRFGEWNVKMSVIMDKSHVSSTDDEDTSPHKSKAEESDLTGHSSESPRTSETQPYQAISKAASHGASMTKRPGFRQQSSDLVAESKGTMANLADLAASPASHGASMTKRPGILTESKLTMANLADLADLAASPASHGASMTKRPGFRHRSSDLVAASKHTMAHLADLAASHEGSMTKRPGFRQRSSDLVEESKITMANLADLAASPASHGASMTKRPGFRQQSSALVAESKLTMANLADLARLTQETVHSMPSEEQEISRAVVVETARERHRAQTLARDAFNPQNDPTVLRRRIRSSRLVLKRPSDQKDSVNSDLETNEKLAFQEIRRKYTNTARERRREQKRFSFELK